MDETTHTTSFAQTNTTLAFTADTPSSSTNEGFRRLPAWSFRPASPTNNADPSPLVAAPAAGQAALEQATRNLEHLEH
ncbi:hypothetical protein CLAFUW4_07203 [Fulvia fulva]|uniref:Uncharacterized protein n=1 Tax=Passalora fulva TaxID=5499 RepID=A0A9Q8PAI9_PASFU|nr:uncharacterized protein CLAFUR5_07337 [Fulvia fulva]KAK4622169.1 hypothetical protein CLAFUR4_07211 [Fulvia fulva]KAK4623220.1 hypothetical protein CLAFUR0_07208 [Fulvia fulva]UJO18907.1 hypothetical protein CLAFUR5_07337 [Fulvia fulva]WPV16234.1 hypothetical protein CLAFUW4_07203 [Fulvia fulva]WPV30870.1 hypothetical protein CLAFUW7_07204 [Fulvia fulva]